MKIKTFEITTYYNSCTWYKGIFGRPKIPNPKPPLWRPTERCWHFRFGDLQRSRITEFQAVRWREQATRMWGHIVLADRTSCRWKGWRISSGLRWCFAPGLIQELVHCDWPVLRCRWRRSHRWCHGWHGPSCRTGGCMSWSWVARYGIFFSELTPTPFLVPGLGRPVDNREI